MIVRLQFSEHFSVVRNWAEKNLHKHGYAMSFPFKYIDLFDNEDAIAFSLKFHSKKIKYLTIYNEESTD